jgi:hypothetical protein
MFKDKLSLSSRHNRRYVLLRRVLWCLGQLRTQENKIEAKRQDRGAPPISV